MDEVTIGFIIRITASIRISLRVKEFKPLKNTTPINIVISPTVSISAADRRRA